MNENGFDDWYLPSLDDLRDAIQAQLDNEGTVTGFPEYGYFWTSTEISDTQAWMVYYEGSDVVPTNSSKGPYTGEVRCLR